VLTKIDGSDYNTEWADIPEPPAAGLSPFMFI
jgi:hypothetical protein